jgi:hypothetical protein
MGKCKREGKKRSGEREREREIVKEGCWGGKPRAKKLNHKKLTGVTFLVERCGAASWRGSEV